MSITIQLAERGLLPDGLIRLGIRRLLAQRLHCEDQPTDQLRRQAVGRFADALRAGPLAIQTQAANEQHYEVPTAFFQRVLGSRLKYSCCYYERDDDSLDEAEAKMLELTCERAGVADGMDILELGCGWGSLGLWMAERYPRATILAISNSQTQQAFIRQQCRQRGLSNLDVQTVDMRDFQTDRVFDRVVSVEMFEHLRNYELLFRRIAGWLRPEGQLFAHVFCHRALAYAFQTDGRKDWMGRHFFTGGIMPSTDLFAQFPADLSIQRQWQIDGRHYARTCEDWLANLDRHRQELLQVLAGSGARDKPDIVLQRWRMFFMACAELFAYRGGSEWLVSHYLFQQAGAKNNASASCGDVARTTS
jgi:cyclopropane-fatty-acyl-phospholipid synthase